MQVKPVGLLLRKHREELNLSTADIARRTFIRQTYIVAIEDGRYDLMPDPVVIRGFIRNYAETMALEADAYVQRFNQELSMAQPNQEWEEIDFENMGKTFQKNMQVVSDAANKKKGYTKTEKAILFFGAVLFLSLFAWWVYF